MSRRGSPRTARLRSLALRRQQRRPPVPALDQPVGKTRVEPDPRIHDLAPRERATRDSRLRQGAKDALPAPGWKSADTQLFMSAMRSMSAGNPFRPLDIKSRRLSFGLLTLATLFVVSVAPGCNRVSGMTNGSGTTTGSNARPLPTSSWTPGDVAGTAMMVGTLRGSAKAGGGCVWLGTNTGGRQAVIWPAGYQVRFMPRVEIIDPSGGVVAYAGQTITVGGGLGSSQGYACMFGKRDAFFIESSVRATSS